MEEEFDLLVSLPSDFATLALIILLPADGASTSCAGGAVEHALTCSAATLRLWQIETVRRVNSLQPGGGPLLAHSASHVSGHAAVHAVCHKASAVATFRALAALKQQLQLKISKDSMRLRLSSQDLQSAMHHVLLQTLAPAGWSQLSDTFLLRTPLLAAAEGQVCTCESLHIKSIAQPPHELQLVVRPGASRFRPLCVASLLPEAASPLPVSTPCAELAARNVRLWGMQIPCTVLPDCRPAILAGIKPGCSTAAEEAGMRNAWRLHTGWELPDQIPYIVEVRFSADEDDAVVGVPSCCVWSAGGLTVVPAKTKVGSASAVLRCFAGDIVGSSYQFWPGKALSIYLVSSSVSGSGTEHPTQRPQWTSAKDFACTAGQREPACIETSLVPLSEVDAPAGESGGAVAARGAAQAERRASVKPSAALQAYLTSLPAIEDAGSNSALSKLPALTATPGSHNAHLHAAPKGADTVLGQRPYDQRSALLMTSKEQQALLTAGVGATCAPTAMHNANAPMAARACVKPTFADHKRPRNLAGTAAHTKFPAQSKPKTATCAKRPAAGKPPTIREAALAQQQAPAGTGMAPNAQHAALEGETAGAAAASRPLPRKRTKAEDLDAAQVEVKVQERHAAEQLDKLSIPELKCFLKARKQALSGKKADLVARVSEVLAKVS